MTAQTWPTHTVPEVIGGLDRSHSHFTREYLFVV
jgi:hypothetical protein